MTAAILCIGTELTRGELLNTNAQWLATAITDLGMEVAAMNCVDDHPERIQRALRRLGAEHEVLVCTGGLGPTTDDITTECVAAVLGVPLVRDRASLDAIAARMSRFGRIPAPSNAKQADFPEGARILPNAHGTAPGFSVELERSLAFFMPGVPREMVPMFEAYVAPAVLERVRSPSHQILIRSFGAPESSVNDALAGLEQEHGIELGYRANFPEIEVKVLARGPDRSENEARARRAADEVYARLDPKRIYGEGLRRLPQVLGDVLSEKKLTIAVGESCTGGQIASLLTDEGGASLFFAGGIVAYANSVKTRLLGVPETLLAAHGAVSPEVARAMAEGALHAFESDLAVSATGIAGPGGGTNDKPVGLVHYAVATPHTTFVHELRFPGTRAQIRTMAAWVILARTLELLRDGTI
jgi:nicotinamide-nucleotide amidase